MHPYYGIKKGVSLLAILSVAFMVAGCEIEPEVVEPAAPPPPTPQEIADKIIADLQLNLPPPAEGSTLPKSASQQFLSAVKSAKNQNSADPVGKQALEIVSAELDARLRALVKRKLWEHVLTYCDAHVVLNPGSTRFDREKEKAIVELEKPQVTIKSFFFDGNTNQTTIFLDFYLPLKGETHREHARVGEEFHGLRLVEIIGNNQGVTMEYLKTDETFDVLTGS